MRTAVDETGGLVGAGVAGLLVIAGCPGTGSGALGPPAKVTIVSGNLTFSSAATRAGRTAAPARQSGDHQSGDHQSGDHRSLDHRAGDAIVAGLSGPGSDDGLGWD